MFHTTSFSRCQLLTGTFALFAATCAVSGIAAADARIKDAALRHYTGWGAGKVNIRLDSVERVEHIDGRPIASSQDPNDASNGYTILSFSVQNAGDATSIREANISEVFDDESEIDGHSAGPFVGSGKAFFSGHLEHNQTVHIRYIQMNTPADRKITKIILDPSDGGAKLRFALKDDAIKRLPEIPLAAH